MRAVMVEALASVRDGQVEQASARRDQLSALEIMRLDLALVYRAGDLARAHDPAAVLWRAAEVDVTVAAVLVEGSHPELGVAAADLLLRTTREAALDLDPHWQKLAESPADAQAWASILSCLIASGREFEAIDGVARALAEGHADFALWAKLVELLMVFRRRAALLAAIELAERAFPRAGLAAATSALIFLGIGELEAASRALESLDDRLASDHPLVLAARSALAAARASAATSQ
jgi:tetratricopeptide (TPR) repeat protein